MNRFFIPFILILVTACSPAPKSHGEKLLLLSFDGFRHDYLTKTDTPNFDALIKTGVTSEGLIPVFPTKTFPNYYSIATGLYPENSGFISNNMLDPETGKRFSMRNRDAVENPDWYGGEPIWNTAEKQGVKAGAMFWVGSEAPVQGMRPTHWMKYDASIPDSSRVDSVIHWLSSGSPEEVDLATLYFSFVDTKGHIFGPNSPELINAVERADDIIGYLREQMQQYKLQKKTNIIIVADHGMAEVSRDRIIVLDDIMNPSDLEIIEGSPAMMANVKGDDLEEVYQALKENEAHYRVFKKEEIPERFHLKDHPRVPELLLLADIGYTMNTKEYFDTHPDYPSGGTHGFDNRQREMHGLFIAAGPDFKNGIKADAFESIHLYSLMCHLLHLDPAPNDGNLKVTDDLLK